MVELAARGGSVNLKTLAERQGVSPNYLEQIVAELKKNKLVVAKRGASGGYALSRPPEDISAGDVLRALEGNLSPVACIDFEDGGEDAACGAGDCRFCRTKSVWSRLRDSVNEAVDSVSLRDLADGGTKDE